MFKSILRAISLTAFLFFTSYNYAQTKLKTKYKNTVVYTGIEVGSKGVKMSILEIGKNAQQNGSFTVLKDTSINSDFISFSAPTFSATVKGLSDLYKISLQEYEIPANRIFTVISSGVKMQADKEQKIDWVNNLIDSFRLNINEPTRKVDVVDVKDEARLSHLGIVPDSRRYTTFLMDIGSGNTKGGFFPGNDTKNFKLFQVNWGTKSTVNETEKRMDGDNSIDNYYKQLSRVLYGAESTDIAYAVNASGAYPYTDNIAISGGIAWALANLIHPEISENPVVAITYKEVEKFQETLYKYFNSVTPNFLTVGLTSDTKELSFNEIKSVLKVFDQKALLGGTGLLLKIMRQFESAFETKQFFLIKNGQVGWVSAYVDQAIAK